MPFYFQWSIATSAPDEMCIRDRAKAENKPIYTDPYMAASLNAMVITFAAPIKNIGVTGIDASIEELSNNISQISKTEYSYAFVTDQNGNVIMPVSYTHLLILK